MPVHIPLAAVPVVLIRLLNVYKYRLHTVSAVKPAVCLETSHYTCAFSDCEPEKGRLTVCQVIDKKVSGSHHHQFLLMPYSCEKLLQKSSIFLVFRGESVT